MCNKLDETSSKDRMTYIGSADIPTMLGLNEFESYDDLLNFKLTGQKEEKRWLNKYREFGKQVEPAMIRFFELEQKVSVHSEQAEYEVEETTLGYLPYYVHCDALYESRGKKELEAYGEKGIYEIKTISDKEFANLANPRKKDFAQIQYQFMISGFETCVIDYCERLVIGEGTFKMGRSKRFVIRKDDVYIQNEIVPEIERFQADLLRLKQNPELLPTVTDKEDVEQSNAKALELQLGDKLITIAKHEKKIKQSQDALKALKAEVAAAMGKLGLKKYINEVNGVTITYLEPSTRQGSIDTKKAAEDGIDLEPYRKAPVKVKESCRITLK